MRDRAIDFFGAERDLASITVVDVLVGPTASSRHPTVGRDDVREQRPASSDCLSNLYKRARAERVVPQVTIRWATSTRSRRRHGARPSGSRSLTPHCFSRPHGRIGRAGEGRMAAVRCVRDDRDVPPYRRRESESSVSR